MSSPAIPDEIMKAAREAFHAVSPLPDAFDAFNTALILEAIARGITAEQERLRPLILDLYIELLWDAFNAGIVRDGKWMDGGISDAEWLRADLGLGDGWHDALSVQAMLPDLARRKAIALYRATGG